VSAFADRRVSAFADRRVGAWAGRAACAAALAAALSGGVAIAQDDPTFAVNAVLVTTFDAAQPFLEPEAERVRGLVESALARSYVVLTMRDVPAFTDTTADVYLRSCPDGQYLGCVFVVGGKAETDWVVGGQISAVDGGYRVVLSFLDMSKAKLVMDTSVDLDGTNDATFQEGILKLMDALVGGDVNVLEAPKDPEAEALTEQEKEARARAAQEFSAGAVVDDPGERSPDDAPRDAPPPADLPAEGEKVTGRDLEAMEEQGGVPPWEKVALTRSQYKMYRNSGQKLDDFRDRLLGRKGQLLFRLSGGVSSGPWGQTHDTWYLLNEDAPNDIFNATLDDLEDDVSAQSQSTALGPGAQLEVNLGLASWVEIGVFGGLRFAPYAYRFFAQREGSEGIDPPAYFQKTAMSWQVGARLGFIPFPAFPVRPTFHLGGSYWSGNAVRSKVAVPPALIASIMPANNLILLHVNPGVEVSAGKWVLLWTRFDLDVPILGRSRQYIDGPLDPSNPSAAQAESARPELPEDPPGGDGTGFGIGASAGITIRVGIGPKRR
jgi:hypothetical protein